jgi:glycine cleavage system H protein
MSQPLTFMMGKFSAEFPTDRSYCKNHMWGQPQANGRVRFGFTAYAVRLLQDVYFLDWSIDAGTPVKEKQLLGNIESKKAESELYAPLAGVLSEFNAELLSDPSAINVDKYGRGWLFEMEPAAAGPLLSPDEYLVHLAAVWETTQRLIKGQLND